MFEHLQSHAPDRALRHLGEYRIAQFTKQRAEQPQQTVAHDQKQRDHQHRMILVQRIYDLLEHQRHGDVGEFGQYQQRHRQNHPALELHQVGNQ